jgi:hypothetical protein
VAAAAFGAAWLVFAREAPAGRVRPASLDVDLVEARAAATMDAPPSESYSERIAHPSDASEPLEIVEGTHPSLPRGTPLRVRLPDGSIHDVELRPLEARESRDAYPPEGSRLAGTRLTVLHENGVVAEAGEFAEGQTFGHRSYWNENGQQLLDGEYESGLAQGLWREWSEHGGLAGEAETDRGEFHGDCRFWKLDGSCDEQRSGVYERGVKVREL